MAWQDSLSSHIWIFSVGRGNAAFVRSGLNQGFILDMGCSQEFNPSEFIQKHIVSKLDPYNKWKIAQAILSHPHSDHIADCNKLNTGNTLYPTLLTCPHDKDAESDISEKLNWARIKNIKGSESIVSAYKGLYSSRSLPLQTIKFKANRTIPNLEYGIFYIRPPVCEKLHESDDNKYGNSTSILFYYRHGNHTILFPGDVTPEAMERILADNNGVEKRYTIFDSSFTDYHPTWHEKTTDQPSLKKLLQNNGLSILVAPHHGLSSCYSEDLYSALKGGKPGLVVISEKRHRDVKDGNVDSRYQSINGAFRLPVRIEGTLENRISVTTINGHHILIIFSGTGSPKVYAEKDATKLFKYLN